MTLSRLLIFSAVLCLLLSCSMGKLEYEILISEKEDYYNIIDPVMLMSAIAQGNKDNMFLLRTPFADESEMWSLPEEKTVYWEQPDYYRIAQVLNEYIGNEPLENWEIKYVILENNCTDAGRGFMRGSFEFFKVASSTKGGSRAVMMMDIQPWRKITRVYSAAYSPVVEKWTGLDFEKVKISAIQAIEIAEKNGGSDARNKVENKCLVSVSMIAPGSGYNWIVNYTVINEKKVSNTIYEALVDSQDGKFQVVLP